MNQQIWGLFPVTALLMIAALSSASAESFLLKTGERIDGKIVRASGNTVSIKLDTRGMRQMPISDIELIEVPISSGEQVAGQLVGWDQKTYEIITGDRVVSVRDGEVVVDVAIESGGKAESGGAQGTGGPRIVVATPPKLEQETIEPAIEPVVATVPRLAGSPASAEEGAGEVVFRLDMSAAIERSLVVIYSAVDQSAKGGEDFEKRAGVLTIEAGATSAEISIPLIDDDRPEEDEAFALFLTVDPSLAVTDDRQLTATIVDDDS